MAIISLDNSSNIGIETVTIISGVNESPVIQPAGRVLIGIRTPATVDGSQLSFKISTSSNGSFLDYYNAANELVIVEMASNRHIGLIGYDFSGTNFFKLVSITLTAEDRDYGLVFKGYGGA